MAARLVVRTLVWAGGMGVILFLSAGTVYWPAGWAFLILTVVLSLVAGLSLARSDPALIKERLGSLSQKDQAPADKVFMSAVVALYGFWLVFMPLDAVRFAWSSVPLWVRAIGVASLFLADWISYRAMRENSFAAPVVKIQKDRGHRVITTGPYSYVRHPMYFGGLFYFIGAPLLLGSWWGLAVALAIIVLLCLRIPIEERTLRAGLEGYDAYAARVRYRLIPLIW
jgi:protein-S-isoprenylcysteine O-methyltransferase Ste14